MLARSELEQKDGFLQIPAMKHLDLKSPLTTFAIDYSQSYMEMDEFTCSIWTALSRAWRS